MRDIYSSPGFFEDELVVRGKVLGSVKSAIIRPNDYGWAALNVRIFAAALMDMMENHGLGQRTAEGYASAVRSFGRFLASHHPARNLLLGTDNSKFEEFHFLWEQDMAEGNPTSSSPARYSSRILVLVQYIDAEFMPLGKSILERAQRGPYVDRKPDKPRQEFSNAERLILREAARNQVRSMETRLGDGQRLLAAGHNGQDVAPNISSLLRKLRDGELSLDQISELSDPELWKWPASLSRVPSGSFRVIQMLRNLLGLLSPSPDDLIALEVLLLFETGWAPEQLRGLRVSEFVESPGGRTYLKHKPRAGKSTHEVIANSGGNWSTNVLIDRWLSATQSIRLLCGETSSDFVFILGRYDRGYPGWIVDRPPAGGRRSLRTWIADRGLDISEPRHVGRIRKTAKLIQGLRAGTLAGAADGDHHVEVFKGHYLPTTTIYTLTPVILQNATERLFVRMTETDCPGPVVIAASSMEAVADPSLPTYVHEAAESLATETAVDRSLLPVSCKNILDSPFAGPGTLCPERIRQCFSCSNSVVFEDHLPRVLSFADRLETIKAELPPPQFMSDYGQVHSNVLAVLDSFPDSIIRAARKRMAAEGLNFPLNARIELA